MNTTRRIYRNTRDRKIGGVAAGLGDYLAVDPVIIRLAFVLAVFLGGFGLLAYLVAWIIIPAGGPDTATSAPTGESRWDGRLIAGVVIGAIGAVALAGSVGEWWHDGPGLWPLLLVGGGAALILWRRDRPESAPPTATGEGPGDPGPDPSRPEGNGPAADDTASDPEGGGETKTAEIGGAQAAPSSSTAVAVATDTEASMGTRVSES